MTWTSRREPYENDKTIMLSGPVGWGWGGNFVALPCGSYDLVLRIGIPEGDPIVTLCRVWIELDFLKAVQNMMVHLMLIGMIDMTRGAVLPRRACR